MILESNVNKVSMCRAVIICGGGNDVVLLCGEDGSGAEAGGAGGRVTGNSSEPGDRGTLRTVNNFMETFCHHLTQLQS